MILCKASHQWPEGPRYSENIKHLSCILFKSDPKTYELLRRYLPFPSAKVLYQWLRRIIRHLSNQTIGQKVQGPDLPQRTQVLHPPPEASPWIILNHLHTQAITTSLVKQGELVKAVELDFNKRPFNDKELRKLWFLRPEDLAQAPHCLSSDDEDEDDSPLVKEDQDEKEPSPDLLREVESLLNPKTIESSPITRQPKITPQCPSSPYVEELKNLLDIENSSDLLLDESEYTLLEDDDAGPSCSHTGEKQPILKDSIASTHPHHSTHASYPPTKRLKLY